LDYWLGERAELSRDGSIVGVVRAENVEVPAPARSHETRSAGPGRRQVAAQVSVSEGGEAEEEEMEDWEAEGGVIRGFVRAWDGDLGTAVENDEREQDLAFSSNSIETRDVVGSDFKYAKFMSLPFFGCGMVDLPPGGFKRAKNARKMQMVFFVHTGKVLVRVGDAEFTISSGGVWHVPRGKSNIFVLFSNFFSFFQSYGTYLEIGQNEIVKMIVRR
jgi:centromere protein C